MNYLKIAVVSSLGMAALFATQVKAADQITLCTGSQSGIYYEAGLDIAKAAGRNLEVIVQETAGTSENIDRVLYAPKDEHEYSCDAFIGQPDGMVNEVRSTPAVSKKVRQVGSLHREYLQVVCGKDSGVDDLGDLESDPSKYTIAVGEEGSGAWLVWKNLISEDEDYAEVRTVQEGGISAISSVATGDVTCALVTGGLGIGAMNDADSMFSDTVSLVGANDKDFNDAVGIDGKTLYEYREIDGAYQNLQGFFGDIDTLTWNARVWVNTEKVANKKVLEQFTRAVAQAAVGIKGKYGK